MHLLLANVICHHKIARMFILCRIVMKLPDLYSSSDINGQLTLLIVDIVDIAYWRTLSREVFLLFSFELLIELG